MEKLDLMRPMEADGLDTDFDRIALEVLELDNNVYATPIHRWARAGSRATPS